MGIEIKETISKYIAEEILQQPGRTVKEDEALITGGLIDSFRLMDLGLFVEDTYGVIIEDTELNADTFDTVAQLAALVEERRSA
jgi:acyl carrier protein